MTTDRQGSRQLRVLFVINGLGTGGAERSLAELLPYYLTNGIHPLFVCLRQKKEGVESAVRALGCDVHFLPPRGLAARVRALRQTVKSEEVHLIHTTLFDSDILGRLAAAGTGVPVLTSLVNTSYEPVRLRDPNVRRARLWAARTLDGWTARHLTSHFHAISETVKESAVRTLRIPAERVTVVQRGREGSRLGSPNPERRREARRRLGIPDNAEVIVNVARQEYQKGQKYLLEAAAILGRTRPRLVVVVAGREGHASRALQELRDRLQLGDRVRFLGHREDVPEVLAASDVFAFPSVYEGLGGAVIEATALGLPIVASDLPALREVVEDGGNALLVRSGSSTSLAAALGRILDDGALAANFSVRSLEIFRERFTVERSAEGMIELYRRLTASRKESRRRKAKVDSLSSLGPTPEADLDGTAAQRCGTGSAPADAAGLQSRVPFPYSIRECDARDEPAMLALLRRTLGETPASRKTAEYWRWKHVDNPFGSSYSVCAWDHQRHEIVGLRILMWWSLREPDGGIVRAARAVDTATHPDHQRRGVFSTLTNFAIHRLREQGVSIIFNTPNRNSLPGYLKMGWQVVTRWPLYVRPVQWLRTGGKLLKLHPSTDEAGEPPGSTLSNLTSWRQFRTEYDAELAQLLTANEQLRRHVGYRTQRSLAYLDWRYGSHPDVEYGVHTLRDCAGLNGLVVARPVRGIAGLTALLITEMILRTPSWRAGTKLIRSLLRTTASDYLVAHFAPGTFEWGALLRAGFVRAPGHGVTFVTRLLDAAPHDPTLARSWDLTLGELEIF